MSLKQFSSIQPPLNKSPSPSDFLILQEFLSSPDQIQIEQSDLSKLNVIDHDQESLKTLALLSLKFQYDKPSLELLKSKIKLIPRQYVARESFNGPALTTMTLDEAIKGGYQLSENQYNKQIDELLNRSQVPINQRNTFIKLIQTYPDMFDVIRNYGNKSNSLIHALIKLYYDEVPSMVQQLYTYAVNYPLFFSETPRRQQLSMLPRIYLDSLYQIYSTRDIEVILNTIQNPLELYLIQIFEARDDQLPAIAHNIGMIIPKNKDKRQYILQFIHEYRNVVTRNDYTDQEIMTYIGYIGEFENRNMLIDQAFRIFNEGGFMVYKTIDRNAAVNVETTLLTPLNEILEPYLVFGTPSSYRVLELEEVLEGNYTESQISHLKILLPAIKLINPQLSNVKLNTIKDDNVIKEILYKIFYAGMYLRGWKGPGNPYSSSGSNQSKAIFLLQEVLNQTPQSLKSIPIFDFIDKIIKGDQCIREASQKLVITANYYINTLFKEVILEFDPKSVEFNP